METTTAKLEETGDYASAGQKPASLRERMGAKGKQQGFEVHTFADGLRVGVRGLRSGERDQYEQSMLRTQGKTQKVVYDDARAKLLALTLCDPDTRANLYTLDDTAELTQWDAAFSQPLYNIALRLSGITEKDQEELVKNSERARTAAS